MNKTTSKFSAAKRSQVLFLRSQVKLLPQGKGVQRALLLGMGSLLAAVTTILLFWKKLPPEVPVFYSRPWGQEQLGGATALFVPLAATGMFLVANLVGAGLLERSSLAGEGALLKKSLVWGGTVLALLSTITVIRVVFLVI